MVIVYSRLTNSPINIMSTNKAIHVFLSHNSVDKPQVEQVAHRLQDAGFDVWLDKWNLIPGDPWQEGIEDALDECDCCLVFVGREGNIGPWQNVEMRAAIDHQVSTQRLRVIPVLLPGSERGDPGQLPTFLRRNTWVEFRYSLDEPDTFTLLVAGIKHEKPPIEGELVNSENPYRGLEVFDIEHSRFFFGRKAVTEWLLNAVRPSEARDSHARFRDNRFLAIVGASGSGKSSVARAGLLAALQQGQLPNSEHWPQIDFTPGEKPLQNLALALKKHPQLPSIYQVEHTELRRKFLEQPLQLHSLALEWLKGNGQQRLVILADQFEEIFTLCRNDAERQAFLDNLLHAAYDSTGQVIVILTLRADFYPNLTPYEQLSRAVEAHQYLLNPLNETELREAITLPAQLSGAEVEALLVDDLVKDTLEQPGSLPLLQFALSRLWKQRSERVLRLKEYREFGGLIGALEQRANGVYESLSPDDQAQCRLVFRRLVQPGEGTTDTRRRARLDEFSGDQQRIVRLMVDERLLTTRRDSIDSDESDDKKNIADSENTDFVEVAHEALIGGWPRLKNWVSKDRISIQTQHLVSSAAKEWDSSGRKVQGLLPEARLLDAEQWVGDYPEQATLVERAFVESEGRVVRRQRNRVKWFAGVMAVVAVGMVVLALFAFQQRSTAISAQLAEQVAKEVSQDSAKKAKERELDAKHNLAKTFEEKSIRSYREAKKAQDVFLYKAAWLYALEALNIYDQYKIPNSYALSTLSEIVDTPLSSFFWDLHDIKIDSKVIDIDFNKKGDKFFTQSRDGIVRVWDFYNHKVLSEIYTEGGVTGFLSLTNDGKYLVDIGGNNRIHVWSVDSRNLVGNFYLHSSAISTINFLKENFIISTDRSGRIIIWNMITGEVKKEIFLENSFATSIEVNLMDMLIYIGVNGDIFVYDESLHLKKILPTEENYITHIKYNHVTKRLISLGSERKLKVWNVNNVKLLKSKDLGQKEVHSISFNSNGNLLILAAMDQFPDSELLNNYIRFLDMEHDDLREVYKYYFDDKKNSVCDISIHPITDIMACSFKSGNKEASFLSFADMRKISNPVIKGSFKSAVFYDGLLYALSKDGVVSIWDAQGRAAGSTINTDLDNAFWIGVDNDSICIMSSEKYNDTLLRRNILKCIDRSGGVEDFNVGGKYFFYDKNYIDFRSEKFIISGGNDIVIFNSLKNKTLNIKGHNQVMSNVSLLPKSNFFLATSGERYISIYDIITGEEVNRLEGHEGSLYSLAAHPNGKNVFSTALDRKMIIWNLETGDDAAFFEQHEELTNNHHYSPDGNYFIYSVGKKIIVQDLKKRKRKRTILANNENKFNHITISSDSKFLASISENGELKIWSLFSPEYKMIFDIEPRKALDQLTKLWDMERDDENLLYRINLTKKYSPVESELLAPPSSNETKIGQLVRWLEDQKAYRKTPAGVPQ